MKALLLLPLLFLAGCATTRVSIDYPDGRKVRFEFAKNLEGEDIVFVATPQATAFAARKIKTDASSVIGAQAGGVGATAAALAPLVTGGLGVQKP